MASSKDHNVIGSRTTEWEMRSSMSKQFLPKTTQPSFRGNMYQNLGHHQDDANYGCPVAGSKTEYRGKQAGVNVSSEVVELCDIISQLGVEQQDGIIVVLFGDLFEFYTRISNKVNNYNIHIFAASRTKMIIFVLINSLVATSQAYTVVLKINWF